MTHLELGYSNQCWKCGRKAAGDKRRLHPLKIGDVFCRWTVIETHLSRRGKSAVKIQCACGFITVKEVTQVKTSKKCKKCKGDNFK